MLIPDTDVDATVALIREGGTCINHLQEKTNLYSLSWYWTQKLVILLCLESVFLKKIVSLKIIYDLLSTSSLRQQPMNASNPM